MQTPLEELQDLTKFNHDEDMSQEKLTYARRTLAEISEGDFGKASLIAAYSFEVLNWDGD